MYVAAIFYHFLLLYQPNFVSVGALPAVFSRRPQSYSLYL